jgi:hypothetical protein
LPSHDIVATDANLKAKLTAASQEAKTRPRPKEIWVPYPMINACNLRPSHFQGQAQGDTDALENDSGPDESSFPPLFGTSEPTRPSIDIPDVTPRQSMGHPPRRSDVAPAEIAIRDSGRSPALRIRRRDFQMMAFHFNAPPSDKPPDAVAREVFYCLRDKCCIENIESIHAFQFKAPQEEAGLIRPAYDPSQEFLRMGIGNKAPEGPGSAWRLTEINKDYSYSATYPSTICVPRAVSDNVLKYGGVFRSKSRIPALSYLHHNGGSITRSSQPMVGLQNRRNPQDERLVSAIFSSHTPHSQSSEDFSHSQPFAASAPFVKNELTTLNTHVANHDPDDANDDVSLEDTATEQMAQSPKKVYGSTRRNLIVDARPKINALANRATGGGMEDISNYTGSAGTPIEKIFLNIANIHVMRQSLERVVESFANSDYLDVKPDQEMLRKSGWLNHISGMLDGAELVARVVGLGGSHALIHCSDGWDRTAQISALAEIMLDPHYRTLEGFITLVQKDFLAFGHKFNHRHGIQGSEKWFEIDNERVMPSRSRETSGAENNALNNFGSKALSGAKNWFEKNRTTLFRPAGNGKVTSDGSDSRPPSPPPNPVLHSHSTNAIKDEREHRTDVKEIAPIFHQFLDAVFQIQHHHPNAFEYNERFLRRLFYQSHAGQYGEFLFNNEKERNSFAGRTPSVWPHFLSRRREFTNPDYAKDMYDTLLLPRRYPAAGSIEVRWWSALFGRKDEEMNISHALAPPDLDVSPIKLAKDFSNFSDHTDVDVVSTGPSVGRHSTMLPHVPVKQPEATGSAVEQRHRGSHKVTVLEVQDPAVAAAGHAPVIDDDTRAKGEQTSMGLVEVGSQIGLDEQSRNAGQGDPLGASAERDVPERLRSKLDFAAFARESAYEERA